MQKNKIQENNKVIQKMFTCECGSLDHMFSVMFYKEDDELFLAPYLKRTYGFFRRLGIAFKYLFKMENRFGSQFDEVILHKDKAIELRDLLNEFIDGQEKKSSNIDQNSSQPS